MADPKVDILAIDRALLKWRGDMAAAAEALGISRAALYERKDRAHLDLEAYRRGVSGLPAGVRERLERHGASSPDASSPVPSSTAVSSRDQLRQGVSTLSGHHGVRKFNRVKYQIPGEPPTLPAMQTGTAAVVDEPSVPIKTAPAKRDRPLRLEPDLRERLQRTAWRLQAHFGKPTNENLVLEQFVEEFLGLFERAKVDPEFAAALKAVIDTPAVTPPPPAPPPVPRRRGKKGGQGQDEGSR